MKQIKQKRRSAEVQKNNGAIVKKGAILFIFFFFCSSVLLLFCSNNAHALEFKKQTLPNSMTVLHVERHNLPIVMVTLLIKASSLNEPSDKAGVAYLTSKMLTEGTSKMSSSEISEAIEFMGASLEATTNTDYTTISMSVLKKDVEKGFEIFSDILLRPSFRDEELKRKKELIKGVLKRSEEEPGFIAEKAFIKEVFGNHPYGRRIEGDTESISKITRDDVMDFYREFYVPQNAILSVVGDLTQEELDSIIKQYLSGWQNSDCPCSSVPEKRKTPSVDKTKVVLIHKDITQANIILGHMGISRSNYDYYAVSVMNYILGGGGFASRLMKVVRDEMGLTYSIHSSFIGNREPGQFDVEVQTKNESAGAVIQEILKQMEKIRTEPVTEQELKDAKAYLTGSFPRRLETGRRIADFLAAVEFYNLGDDYIKKYPEYINRITKDDVLRVAKKYLNPERYVLVVVGAEKKLKLTDFKPSENVH
ncbi:MAG: pitrilysin family protein [Thermodesulfovibrionales bacterium]|nr:pitrilysin family protein [Thermodesulfovibrionales bacterium]